MRKGILVDVKLECSRWEKLELEWSVRTRAHFGLQRCLRYRAEQAYLCQFQGRSLS